MRLSHSISMTLFVSALTALSACSSEPAEDTGDDGGSGTGGTGMSGAGGTAAGSGGTAAGSGGTSGSGGTAAGAGGSGMSGSGGGGVLDHPTDTTQAGIEAFLAAESYKTGAGWRPETMSGDDAALPHLATMRYFNQTIIASKAAGNRPPSMGQHTAGSMSVKEILEGTAVVGKATMLRTDANMWIYYCTSSQAGRCGTGTMADVPYYGTAAGPCACHGSGTNISHDAIPAP